MVTAIIALTSTASKRHQRRAGHGPRRRAPARVFFAQFDAPDL